MTPPFDPRVLTRVPATRWPVSALGAIGVAAGLTTIALAFTITNLVVAVVHGHPVLGTSLWLLGLFSLRALLAAANELVGTWAGIQVSTALREHLIDAWLERDASVIMVSHRRDGPAVDRFIDLSRRTGNPDQVG